MIYRKRPAPPPSYENSTLRKNQEIEIDKWRNSLIRRASNGQPAKRVRYSLALPIRHKAVPNFITELLESFDYKCPFCETKLDADGTEICFYRPPYSALQGRNAEPDEHYYCWLIWQWSNLFPACESCTHRKAMLFPVSKPRVSLGVRADHMLEKEEPMLLDPCYDNPDEHLEFREDGTVTARPGSIRGDITIEILDLNRERLQINRKAEAQALKKVWEAELQRSRASAIEVNSVLLDAYCRDDQPFAGMKRQLLGHWSENTYRRNSDGEDIVRNLDTPSRSVLFQELTPQPNQAHSLLSHQPQVMENYEEAVFVSYAWGGESEHTVDELEQAFAKRGIRIVRDKKDLEYKGSIQVFEQRIGMGKGIVLVISDKYLRSEHCMYELIQLNKNRNLHNRIFPILLADARIYTANDRLNYIKYWEEKIQELEDAIKETRTMTNLAGIYANLERYGRIRSNFDEVTALISDMNVLTSELHAANDFSILISKVEKWMNGKA